MDLFRGCLVRRQLVALLLWAAATVWSTGLRAQQTSAEKLPQAPDSPAGVDWLLDGTSFRAGVYRGATGNELVLTNGLIRRTFRLSPEGATVGLDNLMTGASLLRAVRPEAVLILDGRTYPIGGLEGQEEQAYLLPAWLDSLVPQPGCFRFSRFAVGGTEAPFPWKRKRHAASLPWPPRGVSLTLVFRSPSDALQDLEVCVRYEMYDGVPLLAKSFTLNNGGSRTVRLNRFVAEVLAAVEEESYVAGDEHMDWERPGLHVETDYEFGGSDPTTAARAVVWLPDTLYTSQVNYQLKTPCLLEVRPPIGPDVDVPPGSTFASFRVFELVYDSYDRERRGLALRRMYRTVSPWVTENPVFQHLTSTDPADVRRAVDQCAEAGFDMVILSFGSGLDMEDTSAAAIARYRSLADYAHARGIELGGYSLLASRRISPEDDVIDPVTGERGHAIFGNSPCLGSRWGQDYFLKIRTFLEETGFDLLEHDGSYPGDLCASRSHPGHNRLEDSQWKQWEEISSFYRWCRARGISLNVPDWYFLQGSTKTAIGYREVNWSLPRERQIILGRQNIYDGTWYKTPSMGWTFVPLVEYQGGGAMATLEPLAEHLDAYGAHLAQNFGSGVIACYRGPRLFDTDATKEVVREWVGFFRAHREVLEGDILHLRRPDGRDLDYILHVNPSGREKGLLMVYNPTGSTVERILRVPLYYTGLRGSANCRERDGNAFLLNLDGTASAFLTVTVGPRERTWFTFGGGIP